MTIREIALKMAHQYEDEYNKWCRDNPGEIMNGLAIKAIAAAQAAIGCETIEEFRTLRTFYHKLYLSATDKNQINGFRFYVAAYDEIINAAVVTLLNQQ